MERPGLLAAGRGALGLGRASANRLAHAHPAGGRVDAPRRSHAPRLYDAALRSEALHALQHGTFLGTALLFWWALIHGHAARRRYGLAVLYLFTTALHTTALGALLSLASGPLYPAYGSTQAWGLSPLQDQQLAGLIMWVPGGLAYLIAALILMLAWLKESDRGLRRIEGPALAARGAR